MIPIVFSTDHNFVMPTGVTILSLLEADPENGYAINVIIGNDVTREDKAILKRQVEKASDKSTINFVEIGDTFDKGFEIRGISKACYSRLMIPWLFPQYDKIIYSDVDVIFKGGLRELYDINLGDNLVGGVGGNVYKKGRVKKYLHKLNLNPNDYINSGFLLINSRLQRELNLQEPYINLAGKQFLYQDQDIINIICKDRIKRIPDEYNVRPSHFVKFSQNSVKMIHYIGMKPWDYFTYCWTFWWEVYQRSIFYDPKYAHKISEKILNPAERIIIMRKYVKSKLLQTLKTLTGK